MRNREPEREPGWVKRTGIYILGIILVSLGIVFCKKCNMGISPVSGIPFVLEKIVPITFGNLTMLFHFVNITLQMVLMKKILDVRLLLQIPLAFVFGVTIDFFNKLIVFDQNNLALQIIALLLSILFTALGMVCMIHMDLIQNPPDGFVRQLSVMTSKELGTVKIAYDVSCVVVSVMIGLIFLRKIYGLGIATIASALLVGRTVTFIRKLLLKGE